MKFFSKSPLNTKISLQLLSNPKFSYIETSLVNTINLRSGGPSSHSHNFPAIYTKVCGSFHFVSNFLEIVLLITISLRGMEADRKSSLIQRSRSRVCFIRQCSLTLRIRENVSCQWLMILGLSFPVKKTVENIKAMNTKHIITEITLSSFSSFQ